MTISRSTRDAECRSGFFQGHADKEVQVDDVRCRGIGLRQASHYLVDGEKCLRVRADCSRSIV